VVVVMSVAFNYPVTDGSADESVINSCFRVPLKKVYPGTFAMQEEEAIKRLQSLKDSRRILPC
jgi:hypothetical protein